MQYQYADNIDNQLDATVMVY